MSTRYILCPFRAFVIFGIIVKNIARFIRNISEQFQVSSTRCPRSQEWDPDATRKEEEELAEVDLLL